MLKIYVSCLVPRFYDAENGVCLNCPVADSCGCRGVGGKWTRNTRQSVLPLLFTQGPTWNSPEKILYIQIYK